MQDSHIAIFNVPAPVHTHPTLSIVATLVRRGYRVTYVTSELFSSKISDLGAEVLRCPRHEFPFPQVDQSDAVPIEKQYSRDLRDLASRTLSLVSSFFERNVPNLVLYDTYAFAGPILAERLGAPAVRMTTHLAYDEENLKNHVVPSEFRQPMIDWSKKLDCFFRAHGINRSDVIFRRDVPTVYFYLRDFQLSQHASDRSSIYAGRCASEQPYRGTWKSKRAGDRRAILISSSTGYDQGPQYYRMCMEALSELGLHAVLAIGANNDAAAFDPLPPNCEVVQNIPQIALMPQVDLMICTGGMTTTMEALYHGLPLVMLTHGYPEMEMYAENVQQHGLGIHLRKGEATVDNMRRCVVQIAEDSVLRARVKRTQEIVKRSPGGEEVVNWIEEYLESR